MSTPFAQDKQKLPQIPEDRYRILEELGRGGMGIVVKATHVMLGKIVAIKVLNTNILDESAISRFKLEATGGAGLAHPNLVSINDYGFTLDGYPFLVMEYLEGESLQDYLARVKKLSAPLFVQVFEQLCKGLSYIHSKGIIHRDIKSSNILLQFFADDVHAKLLDFGIAKFLNDTDKRLTATGAILGSPVYMSPEQCTGNLTDARSDIYSLGCVMYECLSGTAPIEGENALQTLCMHVNVVPARLPGLSSPDPLMRNLAQITHRCLEKDPTARFQDCGELLRALQQAHNSAAPLQAAAATAAPPDKNPGPSSSAHLRKSRSLAAAPVEARAGYGRPGRYVQVAGALIVAAVSAPFALDWVNEYSISNELERAERNFQLGSSHWDDCKAKYTQFLKMKKQVSPDLTGKIYSRLGRICLFSGNLTEAEQNYQKALEILQPTGEDARTCIMDSLIGLSECYSRQREYGKSAAMLGKARQSARQWNSGPERLGDIFVLSAATAAAASNEREALNSLELAIAEYSKLEKAPQGKLAQAWLESALICRKMGWTEQCVRRAEQAISLSAKVADEACRNQIKTQAEPLSRLQAPPLPPLAAAAAAAVGSPLSGTAPPPVPLPPQVVPPSDGTADLELITRQNNLTKQKIEAIKRQEAYNRELSRLQQENFEKVSSHLRQYNESDSLSTSRSRHQRF